VRVVQIVDVIAVRPLDGHRVELSFRDGLNAVLDLDQVIRRFEGVFAPLKDPAFFRQVRVDPEVGTVVWPNGADLCPTVLYSLASGQPLSLDAERVTP
jgi:hypothetical protein